MKKIAILIFITITSLGCSQTDYKIDYAAILNSCFSENEIEILNEACTLFETNLMEHYESESKSNNYKLYLKEFKSHDKQVGEIKKPTKEILDKLKNSNVFNEIWTTFSETYYEDDRKNQPKSKDNLYVINPKGKYLKCLIDNQKNETINEFLMTIEKFSKEKYIMTQTVLAKGLSESLKAEDYEDKAVRFIIALNFYYQLEFNDNRRITIKTILPFSN